MTDEIAAARREWFAGPEAATREGEISVARQLAQAVLWEQNGLWRRLMEPRWERQFERAKEKLLQPDRLAERLHDLMVDAFGGYNA